MVPAHRVIVQLRHCSGVRAINAVVGGRRHTAGDGRSALANGRIATSPVKEASVIGVATVVDVIRLEIERELSRKMNVDRQRHKHLIPHIAVQHAVF